MLCLCVWLQSVFGRTRCVAWLPTYIIPNRHPFLFSLPLRLGASLHCPPEHRHIKISMLCVFFACASYSPFLCLSLCHTLLPGNVSGCWWPSLSLFASLPVHQKIPQRDPPIHTISGLSSSPSFSWFGKTNLCAFCVFWNAIWMLCANNGIKVEWESGGELASNLRGLRLRYKPCFPPESIKRLFNGKAI